MEKRAVKISEEQISRIVSMLGSKKTMARAFCLLADEFGKIRPEPYLKAVARPVEGGMLVLVSSRNTWNKSEQALKMQIVGNRVAIYSNSQYETKGMHWNFFLPGNAVPLANTIKESIEKASADANVRVEFAKKATRKTNAFVSASPYI